MKPKGKFVPRISGKVSVFQIKGSHRTSPAFCPFLNVGAMYGGLTAVLG